MKTKKYPEPVAAGRGASNQISPINNTSCDDPVSLFINWLQESGITPSNQKEIIGDGCLHRFHVEGDRRSDLNGWAVLHLDGIPAGAAGSWKTQVSVTWCAENKLNLTVSERRVLDAKVEAAQAQRTAERFRQHNAAAERAACIWRKSKSVYPLHEYIEIKHINAHKARQYGDRLVLPLYDFDATLHSLQFIGPDGDKKLLKGGKKSGCFIPVAGTAPSARVLICEGWATGATLAENDPNALVLAAVDAGNLKAVATGARKKWPDAEIVICADADPIGREKGRAAAIAASALLAIPEFPAGADGTDYNDLALLRAGGAL